MIYARDRVFRNFTIAADDGDDGDRDRDAKSDDDDDDDAAAMIALAPLNPTPGLNNISVKATSHPARAHTDMDPAKCGL